MTRYVAPLEAPAKEKVPVPVMVSARQVVPYIKAALVPLAKKISPQKISNLGNHLRPM
jgi:hypothetical protein